MWLGGDELAGRQAGIRFRTIYVHVYVSYVYYIDRHQMICIISAYIHIHVQTGAMFTIYIDIIWHVSYLRIYVYMCRLASAFGLSMYIYTYNVFATQIDYTRQIPLKMLPPQKSTESRNPKFTVQIQIKSKSHFESVQQNTEESEFFNLVVFGMHYFQLKLSYIYICIYIYKMFTT